MKAIVKEKARPGFSVKEIEKPTSAKPHELLVKVKATSICGTDVHIWKWDHWAERRIKPPRVIGHEFAGEVIEVGEAVQGFKKGDLVSGETHINCGYCFQCRTGNAHICENVVYRGIDVDGCFTEYLTVPANTAWKNDPKIPIEVMSAQEPFGNAVHTTFSGEIAGKTVAVFGCGPTGMCAAALSKIAGAEKVFAIDINDYRLGLVEKLAGTSGGLELINGSKTDVVSQLLKETGGRGVDVGLEMSGNGTVLKQMFKSVRPGGRVSILGVFADEVSLDVTDGIVFRGITVHGINGRQMYDTWYKSAAFLRSGKIDLRKMITHKFTGLEKINEAMPIMSSGESGKIVITP